MSRTEKVPVAVGGQEPENIHSSQQQAQFVPSDGCGFENSPAKEPTFAGGYGACKATGHAGLISSRFRTSTDHACRECGCTRPHRRNRESRARPASAKWPARTAHSNDAGG